MTVLFRPVLSILAQARRPTASSHFKLLPGSVLPLLRGGGLPTTSSRCQVRNMTGAATSPTEALAGKAPVEQQSEDYDKWDKESLVRRVKQLEDELKRGISSKALEPDAAPVSAAVTPATPAPSSTSNGNDIVKAKKTRREKKSEAGKKVANPAKYETRMIALKLAYLGKNYNGFEYSQTTKVATVEEELWKALVKSCLIFPEDPDVIDFSPFDYAKCGRTDKGVSAFGQVINLRVRSQRRVDQRKKVKPNQEGGDASVVTTGNGSQQPEQQQPGDVEMKDAPDAAAEPKPEEPKKWDPITGEIQYCKVLNRLLPPDIRIMAWAPNPPPNFSARFSCRERQYRYFFTQPAYSPMPSSLAVPGLNNGYLDIDGMRKAAKMFEGLHDFRNFAKVDPSKQITNYDRRIYESDIVEVKDVGTALSYLNSAGYASPATTANDPKVYYFHVRGSAFLWHQIRHMVGILFHVGQGLERPEIVQELLDVNKTPRRPAYFMADEVPLVLWDCIFPKLEPEASGASPNDREENVHTPDAKVNLHIKDDGIEWIWNGEDTPYNLHGSTGTVNQMWEFWRERKMDELLAGRLLEKIATQADINRRLVENVKPEKRALEGQKVFRGGNKGVLLGPYRPVMTRDLIESPAEQHDKWARSKGFASAEEMRKIPKWHKLVRANKRKAGDIEGSGSNSGGDAA